MIYDYKEWEDPDFADDKVIDWNIGGRSDKYTSRQVHPVNKWVADQTGLPVLDMRPPHRRPASSIPPRTGPPDALDLLMEANRQAMALEAATA